VEPAGLAADYANTGIATDMAKQQSATVAALMLGATARLARWVDFQITGGSTSIRAFEQTWRQAGAMGRALLVAAAARRWGVDADACDTANGFVTYQANRLSFADIAGDVQLDDAPAEAPLRARPRLIGQPLTRLDIPAKVDGSARFGLDVRLPGMLYAAIAQGPIGGVRQPVDKAKLPAGCRLVEQPDFVAVVADGWWRAKTGLDALELKWQPGPQSPGPVAETALAAALAPGGKPLPPAETLGSIASEAGDIAGLATGAITADYTLPYLAHACLEPMTATARPVPGGMEVWAPTQSATLARWAVSRALGLATEAVTIFPTLLGGGFGRKVEGDVPAQAARIAHAVNAPVQLIWSREEDLAHDMYRPAVAARLAGKARAAGIDAWACTIAAPDVNTAVLARNIPHMPDSPGEGAAAIEGALQLPYALPVHRIAHKLVTVPVPLGWWRSVGHSFTGFIVESFIDELAASAGVDPGAFRLTLLKDSPRHAEVLKAVLAMAPPLGKDASAKTPVGRGVALVESFGSIVAELAEVEMQDGKPRVRQVWAAVDCGRVVNPDTVVAQVEGGIIYGLTAALHGRISFNGGQAEQSNFGDYPLLGLADAPAITTRIIASTADPGGIGEPGTPPIAPAVANAIFAATGQRRRSLPLVAA
jgi:isoquinoline 1-oxidoreductase beta subunit